MASTQTRSARSPRLSRPRSPLGDGSGPNRAPASSSFLGRAEQISQLAELLERNRLITLTGPPGIGKSRLALHVAGGLDCTAYAEEAPLVELAPVTRPTQVPRAVASALSIEEVPGQGLVETIVARLGPRRLLLVLDNCEHLVGGCVKLVERLLSGCPELRVLATSREPLALGGERVMEVPPLAVPGPGEPALPERLGDYDGVALFVERAGSAQPGFTLNPYVAPAVAEICRRLDGIPLAIELAAARIEILTPGEIARRLDDRFSLLSRGAHSALPRHQTLEAALDWSHDLLSAPERALLRRLSVFAGGFELDAAESVCAGPEVERDGDVELGDEATPGADIDPGEVSNLLALLVSKSLVAAGNAGSSSRARYRLLETIRAYGIHRLEESGEAPAVRAAHARFHLALAERAEPELTGPDQQRWLERLELERENFRSAFEWSLGHGQSEWALRLAGALVLFWRVRCHFSEGRELLEAAIAAGETAPPALRAKALWGAGFMALMVANLDRAVPALEQSLAHYGQLALGDLQGQARALLILGNSEQFRDTSRVLSLLEQSASLAREVGDSWCLAHALGVAGFQHAHDQDDLAAARPLFEECLQVARAAQDKQSLRMGLIGLGSVTLRQGGYRLAESLLEEAVAVNDELDEDYSKATALQYLGKLAIGRGDYRRAQELLDDALALVPAPAPPGARSSLLVLVAQVARAEGDPARARLLLDEVAKAGTNPQTVVLQGMGELAADAGELHAARRLFEEALALARTGHRKEMTAEALFGLGELAREEGDIRRAAGLYNEALELQRQVGSVPDTVASLEALAGLDAAAGAHEQAARVLGAADALRKAKGYARPPWQSPRYEADLTQVRQSVREDELEAAWAKGASLSLEEALAEASKRRSPRGRPESGWHSLTDSEHQVAALVAEGLTNPEIAERLFISLGTVKAHLSHIFPKLGIAGRTELAREVWLREQQRRGGSPT